MSIKRVAVFCGSSTGTDPVYAKEAQHLGKVLAENSIELVFGGGSVGLMNEIANAVLAHNGKAHGVIPEHLMQMEVGHSNLTALHITKDMHERKALMVELSDAFIALPGGFGTLEELMEVITWSQINIHQKEIILFNINGYYDKLVDFIEHSISSGFVRESNRSIFRIASSTEECLDLLGI